MKKFWLLILLAGCFPNNEDLNIYYDTVIVNQINYSSQIDSLYEIYQEYDFSDDINTLDDIINNIFNNTIDSMLNGIDTFYNPIDVNSILN